MNLSAVGPVVLIGAGKMGLALARGWIAGGLLPAALVLVDPEPSDAAKAFANQHGVRLKPNASGVLIQVLVLAVKPQVMAPVMAEVAPSVGRHTLVVSIAAGISLEALGGGLGTGRVIRTMPNTPAQIGKGITGAVEGPALIEGDRAVAEALLGAAGQVAWFDEETALDAVTAISGSGPAYVFLMVEAMAAAGVKLGLSDDDAMRLARSTVTGAAALMEADPAPAAELRANVTSPKGTTEAALRQLMAVDGLEFLMSRATRAAYDRSIELGK